VEGYPYLTAETEPLQEGDVKPEHLRCACLAARKGLGWLVRFREVPGSLCDHLGDGMLKSSGGVTALYIGQRV
jgi:hypothetical protein